MGSGLVGLYAIVVVSGGIMLGTGAAASFTALVVVLAVAQLFFEYLGICHNRQRRHSALGMQPGAVQTAYRAGPSSIRRTGW